MSPRPSAIFVAADTVALRCAREGELQVLLIRRANDPFKGCWALPGGFVEQDEDLPDAAARELKEETELEPVLMDQVGAWGTPGRDPRGRTVSAVYLAVARSGADSVRGGDDAAGACWHPADSLPPLAFDHTDIVSAALRHARARCENTHLAFAFLDSTFGPHELAEVLKALEARQPLDGASRLLSAGRVERATGEKESAYRLSAQHYLEPLREPVVMFTRPDSVV